VELPDDLVMAFVHQFWSNFGPVLLDQLDL